VRRHDGAPIRRVVFIFHEEDEAGRDLQMGLLACGHVTGRGGWEHGVRVRCASCRANAETLEGKPLPYPPQYVPTGGRRLEISSVPNKTRRRSPGGRR